MVVVDADDHRFVEQCDELVQNPFAGGGREADAVRGFGREAAGEHRELFPHLTFARRTQSVTPVHHGLEGSMTCRPGASAGHHQRVVLESRGDLDGAEDPDAGGRQFDRQRQTLESQADRLDRGAVVVGDPEAGLCG
ncbi:hypothetical protein RD149_17695 [Gordonia westfalica]|uniref:Uncharacterized protein n=1 Tax=Gordonia westfalica TaxID=158898 RepID=A0ABU2GVY1_9ACTN|nr:hypothetical protein [Gordonia westfalica]MDS1115591.1 hypothetical protein [Gordonia westfalica]